MAEPLGTIEGTPARLASIIETASIDPHAADVEREMLVRVWPDEVATPASVPDADRAAYCTASTARFHRIDLETEPPVDALFDIGTALSWLSWLGEAADVASITFEGNPDRRVAERYVLRGGDTEVTVPCATDWERGEISFALPERFADGRYHDADGEPMPTTVTTDAATLSRLAEAATLTGGADAVPFRVRDGALRVDARATDGARVHGPLPATVDGPDVDNRYPSAFADVAASLQGEVECQTGQGQDVAIIKRHPEFTLRFVVHPALD